LTEQPELLKVENVMKRFGGITALNGVSFSVKQNEFVGIIGPNGAGKTTLFSTIVGALKPDAGRIVFRGKDITGMRPSATVHLGLARTFQIVRPFLNLTVLENVLLSAISRRVSRGGSRPEDRAHVALKRVGLDAREPVLASKLTHGELKRLGIAQAIALEPVLLLLDEPFGGLSTEEIGIVSGALVELSRAGTSFVIIEHRVREMMRIVNRVIALDQGSVLTAGTPEEVVNDKRVIEAFLGGGANFARSKTN
jgi:branched-chain amino acid transport system ATP-binding protein